MYCVMNDVALIGPHVKRLFSYAWRRTDSRAASHENGLAINCKAFTYQMEKHSKYADPPMYIYEL